MGAILIENIHTSSGPVADDDRDCSTPSAGRSDSRWIQAPIAQEGFTLLVQTLEVSGAYARPQPAPDSGSVQSEISKLQFSSAASFFAFEESLPDNEE